MLDKKIQKGFIKNSSIQINLKIIYQKINEILFTKIDHFLYYLIEFVLENYSGAISLKEIVKISKGNPKGSILSPKLFIFYINEILRKIAFRIGNKELILAYADDVVLISQNKGRL